ncbi:MAG: type IV pili methyl-accepting chemotaxis transducer N-terminal domain-containing protein [Comamonadaceae bacterium]|nr:type IV pili methyl-accepting chemotaxis transducer N-terminal domain-containing protein [Comamonadaceae bacterium]
MSLADQLSNLFKKRSRDPRPEGDEVGEAPFRWGATGAAALEASPGMSSERAGMESAFGDNEGEDQAQSLREANTIKVPLLGTRKGEEHQRLLSILLAVSLLVLAFVVYRGVSKSDTETQQVGALGQALVQAQRMAKSVSQSILGNAQAFPELKESSARLVEDVRGLRSGNDNVSALGSDYESELNTVGQLVDKAEKNTALVLAQQKVLTQVGSSLRSISRQSSDLLEIAETVSSLKLQQNAPAIEVSAAGQLVMLTQRVGKSATEFLTPDGVSPEAVFLLGKDLNSFKEIADGLLSGNSDLRLAPARDEQTRERLRALLKAYEATKAQADGILGNLQGLVSAREAESAIVADSEPLRKALDGLQSRLSSESGMSIISLIALLGSAVLAVLAALGLGYVQLLETQQRQRVADHHRLAAESQEQEAKRVNDANQAAILRLMNELQTVAEGDLTQEATVTEDITGAIADSVNYTVEELRSLVGNVQSTATRVAQTTSRVENTSAELLATSTEQLRDIRETGQSVLDMAARINDVSAQAQESASVARQSLQAAESGLTAVHDAIGGMNAIRDQIQETSKRIKRLGESSQEIGEITELIADITEQTNVLALNAAIQAASAGEAGRGFSVVAEEVQRLAERSGDATRQIAALVKAIQTDTQDAVAAMERSTQGVVQGARLSDNAGTALSEIDRVSRRLAELIEQISVSASKEAAQANDVASNIQQIFAVTEQTGESTRTTAAQVRDLARMADELRQSVARFKIG